MFTHKNLLCVFFNGSSNNAGVFFPLTAAYFIISDEADSRVTLLMSTLLKWKLLVPILLTTAAVSLNDLKNLHSPPICEHQPMTDGAVTASQFSFSFKSYFFFRGNFSSLPLFQVMVAVKGHQCLHGNIYMNIILWSEWNQNRCDLSQTLSVFLDIQTRCAENSCRDNHQLVCLHSRVQ